MGQKSEMRNIAAQQARNQAGYSTADRATMDAATRAQLGDLSSIRGTARMLKAPGPGQLSPWSAGNYASNMNNIADTYAKQREMGFRALGQSGFGTSPGATASMVNTSFRNQGADQTGAYRSALQDTLNQTLQGTNLEQGLAADEGGVARQYGGQALDESGGAVNAAANRVRMGSTVGDVASGFSQIAQAALPFIPGGQLFSAARKGFGNIGRPGQAGGRYADTSSQSTYSG